MKPWVNVTVSALTAAVVVAAWTGFRDRFVTGSPSVARESRDTSGLDPAATPTRPAADRVGAAPPGPPAKLQRNEARPAEAEAEPDEGASDDGASNHRGYPPPLPAHERLSMLEAGFASENADPGWSNSSQAKLVGAKAELERDGSRLGRVECRSTLCRFEVTHPDQKAMEQFSRSLTMPSFWPGPGLIMPIDSPNPGERKFVVFLLREGTDFPDAPEPKRGT